MVLGFDDYQAYRGEGQKMGDDAAKEVSSFFAVGDFWADGPFGYGGALVNHADRQVDILKWCPEYSISPLSDGEEERAWALPWSLR